jgi:hypothetical protein
MTNQSNLQAEQTDSMVVSCNVFKSIRKELERSRDTAMPSPYGIKLVVDKNMPDGCIACLNKDGEIVALYTTKKSND